MFKYFHKIAIIVVGLWYTISGFFLGSGFDTVSRYKKVISEIPVYVNTLDTAQPQTKFYDYINDYFKTPQNEGKKKKVIVIGYDGCRADMLQYIGKAEKSGLAAVLAEKDSQAFLTFCGGANYMYVNTQESSTAPGWCSMLTGVWADRHKVVDNDVVKTMDYPTMLTTLVEDKIIDSATFYTSWGGHFAYEGSTYSLEKKYCEDNNLNTNFVLSIDDAATTQSVIDDLAKKDCSDFIFSILESPDHEGHDKVFSPYYEGYTDGFYKSEANAYDIISAVKARPTYDNEDWLIIITDDHGGSCYGHGNMTIMERMTFIVSNKELLK